MFQIIHSSQFITTPWKNGLGETTELAISDGDTLSNFDWRLSMATVSQNGVFSNFSGYFRNLILIKGNGIDLTHSSQIGEIKTRTDCLSQTLSVSSFDGGDTTYGKLHDGIIVDFNVITKLEKIEADVSTFLANQTIKKTIASNTLCFVYALTASLKVANQNEHIKLPQGDLLKIESDEGKELTVSGANFIYITLKRIS